MQYQQEKFANAALFFAENTDAKKLGVTKLMKLLFFADFHHFEEYGRPILGDTYYHLPEGPVPTASYELYKDTFKGKKETGLEKFIQVVTDKVKDYEIQRIEPLQKLDEGVFSKSDLEILEKTAKKFYDTTGTTMSKVANDIPFIKETPQVYPIDYLEAIDNEEDKKYLAELQKEEEEVDSHLS